MRRYLIKIKRQDKEATVSIFGDGTLPEDLYFLLITEMEKYVEEYEVTEKRRLE